MKRFLQPLVICTLILFSFQIQAKKPKWVKERPNDPSYFIGIGVAEKTQGEYQYVTQARNQALKELSSEIKVTISSNSILTQFENNYELKEEFESKVQTSVSQTLEGYEVEVWEDKHEYWVMMRLSKDKYELNRRMALDKAKKLAATYYYSAVEARDRGDVYEALSYYVKAIQSIHNHIEEDLTYKNIDGDLNLGVDILKGLQKTLNNIELVPDQDLYSIRFSQQMQLPITVKAITQMPDGTTVPINNLPLSFDFTKGEGTLTASSSTNHDGIATCSINRLISKRRLQEITATLNISTLFTEKDDGYKLLKLFFANEALPKAIIPVEVAKSKAYLISEEIIFGEHSKAGPFTSLIKSELSENFFTFTPVLEEADFVVKLHSEFVAGEEKKGSGYSVYIVYGDLSISIVDAKQQIELFSDGISSAKGMLPGGFEHAIKNCREKALNEFDLYIIPKLEQIDM